MPEVAGLVAGGAGWAAGVPDRERAWAAAERVVTILATGLRSVGEVDEDR